MPDDEALALEGLGECRLRCGEVERDVDLLRQALDVFHQPGMPDAERVRNRLADLATT